MKTLFVLIIGAGLGIAAFMYFQDTGRVSARNEAEDVTTAGDTNDLRNRVSRSITNMDTAEIREELERTGKVVRRRAEEAGTVIRDVAADTKITAEIKGRYALDRQLSALRISVNTTDGIVTLSGAATSAEEIQRAMSIALETDGVREVVSTIQVKQQRPQ
ncbi:MAG: BON domain-containing protein [Limisphaerales bacterium]